MTHIEILVLEVFEPLVVRLLYFGNELCFIYDVLSKFLHGMVNPRTFLRILENSVIEQGQLRTEVLESNVGVGQVISPHLRFVLVLRINVVGSSDFLMNRGSKLENAVGQQSAIPFGRLGTDGKGMKLQPSCGFHKLHSAFSTHGLDD